MNFILLGIIMELIGVIYLGLAGILVHNDKPLIKKINKSIIIKYYAIMVTGMISMVIGFFAN